MIRLVIGCLTAFVMASLVYAVAFCCFTLLDKQTPLEVKSLCAIGVGVCCAALILPLTIKHGS